MRSRSEIEYETKAGLTGPSIPNADRLTLEVLLDIRQLLQLAEDRMVKMDERIAKLQAER